MWNSFHFVQLSPRPKPEAQNSAQYRESHHHKVFHSTIKNLKTQKLQKLQSNIYNGEVPRNLIPKDLDD